MNRTLWVVVALVFSGCAREESKPSVNVQVKLDMRVDEQPPPIPPAQKDPVGAKKEDKKEPPAKVDIAQNPKADPAKETSGKPEPKKDDAPKDDPRKTKVPGGAYSLPMPKDAGYPLDDALTADDLREDGHPFKLYLIPLQEGQRYRLEVESKAFDPYLRLLDPHGRFLAADDNSGGAPDARLRIQAAHTGLYRLQVTALNKESKGAFTLYLRPDRAEDRNAPLKLSGEDIETGKAFKPQEERFENGVVTHTFLERPEGKIVDALWSEDGKKLFTLERAGVVRRIDVDTWTEEARTDLKEKCNNLAWCKYGLVVGAQTHVGEVFVLNPGSFKQLKRMAGLNLTRIAASAKSHFVVVAGHIDGFRKGLEDAPLDNQGSLWVIDLRGGKAPKSYNDRCVRGLIMPAEAGGDRVFTQNGEGVSHYYVDELGQLRDTSGFHGFARNGANLGISADGNLLWLPCPDGNHRVSSEPYEKLGEPPHSVFFLNRHNHHHNGVPEYIHSVGPGCKAAGYDVKTGDFYLHNAKRQLIVIDKYGLRKADLALTAEKSSNEPLAFISHPEGGKALVRFADRLTLVDLSRGATPKTSPNLDGPSVRRVLFSSVGKFQEETHVGGLDKVDDGKRLGKTYFVHLEKGASITAYLESHKSMQGQVEIYDPSGKMLSENTSNRLFIGFSTGGKETAAETGVYKIVITNPTGKTKGTYRLGLSYEGGPVPQAQRLPLPFAQVAVEVNEPLKTTPLNLPDQAKGTTIALPFDPEGRFYPRNLLWSADGKAVFLVNDAGDLLRINAEKWLLERKLKGDKKIHQLVASKEGLVAQIGNQQIWLIDPVTLSVLKQFETPAVEVIAASPTSSKAVFAVSHQMGDNSALYGDKKVRCVLLDLQTGELTPQRKLDHIYAYSLVMSPDGLKLASTLHFYDNLNATIQLMAWEDGEFRTKGGASVPAHQGLRLTFSPDSKYLGTTCEMFASLVSKAYAPHTQQVHHFVENRPKKGFGELVKIPPALELKLNWRTFALAFDMSKNVILAQGEPNRLVFFDWEGKTKHEFSLGERVGGSRVTTHNLITEIAVHPEGGQALAHFPDRLVHVDYSALAAANIPPPPFKEPEIKVVDNPKPKDLPKVSARDPFKAGPATLREIVFAVHGNAPPCWNADGTYFFHLEAKGVMQRINAFGDIKLDLEKDVGLEASKLKWSSEGLVIAGFRSPGQLRVIDPKTLEVKVKAPCPGGTNELVVAHEAGLAFVTNVGAKHALIDLKTGKVLTEEIKNLPEKIKTFNNLAFSPDGRYLFARSKDTMLRFRWTGTELVFDDSLSIISPSKLGWGFHFAVAPDSKWVAIGCPELPPSITRDQPAPKSAVFPIDNFKAAPAFTFPAALSHPVFDSQGRLFARDPKGKILIATGLPTSGNSLSLDWPNNQVRHIIPSPRGQRFLAVIPEEKSSAAKTYLGEWK